MQDFSLRNISEKIYFDKTKNYFEEVKRSYYSKNFRSAIVMLYSITICDLMFKLQELKDRFNDKSAKTIIAEIETFQKNNPSNPEWEKRLIELIKDRTDLLKISDYSNIIMLQKHRHLCAHPVLEDNYELYHPNEETTLAHIRNISEGIFINPPLFTKKIIDTLLIDLETVKDIFLYEEDELLERYLNSKYFKHASPSIIKSIFRSLWKIVYKLKNEKCNENRIINSKAIRIIYKKNQSLLFSYIQSEPDYFSDINSNESMYFLIGLLSHNQEIYPVLNESARVLIQQLSENDPIYKSMAWFTFPNLKEHLEWIKKEDKNLTTIHLNTIRSFYQAYLEAGMQNELIDLFISLYKNSYSQKISTFRFSFINYILPLLDKSQLINLLEVYENNIFNHQYNSAIVIKKYTDIKLTAKFNYENYPELLKSIDKKTA